MDTRRIFWQKQNATVKSAAAAAAYGSSPTTSFMAPDHLSSGGELILPYILSLCC